MHVVSEASRLTSGMLNTARLHDFFDLNTIVIQLPEYDHSSGIVMVMSYRG